jgi:cell fate regulator YaaT (PSP1 superfamily)
MTRVVTIKFRNAGKHYNFNARDFELQNGDQVIVETDRGRALGSVVTSPVEVDTDTDKRELKNVLRVATEEDLQLADTNAAREETAFRYCRTKILERQMEMKLVKAEYLFDGSKIIFYFTADGRVDFRELVKDLAHYFHTRIEMRQIGVRDEAKLIGGIGICGQTLCCCTFLTEFAPVSVKMAKEQQLALNPSKISGQCGRLLCCLGYEYETYGKLRKGMPKSGLKMNIEGLHTFVSEVDILRQKITVRIEDGRILKLSKQEFSQLQETGKFPKEEAPKELRITPEPKPARDNKTDEETPSGPPKKKRRRRRRKPSGSKEASSEQQASGQKSPDKQDKPKPESGAGPTEKKQPNKQAQQQPNKEGAQPDGEQKKKRRRRRRRKPSGGGGPKPEPKDQS